AEYFLFRSSDLNFLLSTPISLNTIFSYKILEQIFYNSGLFFLIGGAFLAGLMRLEFFSIGSILLLLISALAFVIIPTVLALLVTFLLVQFISSSRLRDFSRIFSGLIYIGFWLMIQYFRVSHLDENVTDAYPQRFGVWQKMIQNTHLDWTPAGWLGKIVAGQFGTENSFSWLYFSFVIGLAACVWFLCLKILTTQFLKSGTEISREPYKKKVTVTKNAVKNLSGTYSALKSMILKDVKLFLRDSRMVIQTGFMAVMIIFMGVIVSQSTSSNIMQLERPEGGSYVVFFFFSLISAQFASRLIPLEREGFWLLKTVPDSIRLAVKGKLYLSLMVNFIFVLIITLGFCIYFQPGVTSGLHFFLLAVALSLGSSGIGLLIGCLFPRFDWEHPKRMLTQAGSIWLMISSILWYVIVFVIFAVAKVTTGSFVNFSLLFLIVLSIIILLMNLIIIKYSAVRIAKRELTR
ncbi:ABC transporter permease, partial [candidate division KSB1 bacterium]|nr:ABC transporter permease [candidate division KSB1 bacterium]